MKAPERERRDWIIVLLILFLGLLCILITGQWALRFKPSWSLNTNMESRLDPNSDFLTHRPSGFIEPIDASILTQPGWINVFLTPGAIFPTRTVPLLLTATLPSQPTFTVPAVASATSGMVVTANPTNTFVYYPPPPTSTLRPRPRNTRTPTIIVSTPTPPPVADLQITKDNGAQTYLAGGTLTYAITVTNNGPNNILGAVIADTIPAQIATWDWTCTSQSGGASGCDGITGGNANFTDTVDLPNGASILYTVSANISAGASGDLNNTAIVSLPVGSTDPTPGNNSATDTDQILLSDPFPSGNIGTDKDGNIEVLPPGSSVTLTFDSPLVVGSHAGYDLVYYELPAGSGILMDNVILQISDGYNWYTILNWGDNIGDSNTRINIDVIGGSETDNRDIPSALLYNLTGVEIELDGVVPNDTYLYIRIISPTGEDGDGCDVDGIFILP